MEVWNCLECLLPNKNKQGEGAKIARAKWYKPFLIFWCHEMNMKWLINKLKSIGRMIQSINQLANQSTNEPINQPSKQGNSQSIHQSIKNQQDSDSDSSPKSTSKSPEIMESFHPSLFQPRGKLQASPTSAYPGHQDYALQGQVGWLEDWCHECPAIHVNQGQLSKIYDYCNCWFLYVLCFYGWALPKTAI